MKKSLRSFPALLFAVLFLLSTVPAAFAEGEAVISVGKVTAAPGKTVDVVVSIESNPGFSATTMTVVCDPSLVTVNSVTPVKELGGQYSFAKRFVWFSGTDYRGNGPIFTINVTVSENARPGDVIPITLSCLPAEFSNYNEEDVPFRIVPGSVTVPGKQQDASSVFKDVRKTDWFYSAVDRVYKDRLMNGIAADLFGPQMNMSRAMFVTVLWRMDGSPEPSGRSSFSDLKADWYRKAVDWANNNEIVLGVSPTRFSPDVPLTREQIAAIFYRYARLRGTDVSSRIDLSSFPDSDKISGYAVESVSFSVASGLIHGVKRDGNDYLDPRGNATRAQVAQIISRFIG